MIINKKNTKPTLNSKNVINKQKVQKQKTKKRFKHKNNNYNNINQKQRSTKYITQIK